jgi:hypothetical protein
MAREFVREAMARECVKEAVAKECVNKTMAKECVKWTMAREWMMGVSRWWAMVCLTYLAGRGGCCAFGLRGR